MGGPENGGMRGIKTEGEEEPGVRASACLSTGPPHLEGYVLKPPWVPGTAESTRQTCTVSPVPAHLR